MKKNLLILFMLIFGMTASYRLSAKTWRVNKISNYVQGSPTFYGSNVGGTLTYPVFKEINQAVSYSGVIDGDTLHVENYNGEYAAATLTKKLVVIGPGYFLSENPNVSNIVDQPYLRSFRFDNGSEGSQLIGMNVLPNLSGGSENVTIEVDSITIKRCFLSRGIFLVSSLSHIQVSQNYFDNPFTDNAPVFNFSGSGNPIMPSDVIFSNNICKRRLAYEGNSGQVMTFIECNNNVFDVPIFTGMLTIHLNAASFQNNIMKNPAATVNINAGTNNNVVYNISAAGQFGTSDDNIVVSDMTTLFVNAAVNSTDGDYQLLAGSPGSNNGSDGTDRGAFGGLSPTRRYTLSGLAAIPVIYELKTPGVALPTGLNVTIKSRTIK